MLGGKDCLCGGSGVIYDYSSKGDPCPECSTGFPSHMSSKVRYTADKAAGRAGRSCAVVALLILAVTTVVVIGLAQGTPLLAARLPLWLQ